MSAADSQSGKRPGGPKLSPRQRQQAVAQVLAGATQASVAQAYDVHPNSINRLVKSVMDGAADPAKLDWRKRLSETLPTKAVDAIERSVDDIEDVHKAASTGLSVLKGLGHLAGEGNATNVNVLVATINSLPADIRECYLSNDVIDITPDAETTTSSGEVLNNGAVENAPA